MTIPVTERKAGPFDCDGSVVDFDFAFKVFTENDVRVVLTGDSGVADLSIGSGYTVALNADQENNPGGTITTTIVYPTGNTITMDGDLDYGQPTALTNLGKFFAKTIEGAIDRVVILVQQVKAVTDRSIRVPVSSTVNTELPTPVPGSAIGWDATASAITNIVLSTGTTLADLAASTGSTLIGWIQAGVGAVATSVFNKLRLFPVTLQDFGGVGDGASGTPTDNLPALIKAIATGRAIDLLGCENIYVISGSPGQLNVGQHIFGRGATLKTTANDNIILPNDYTVTEGIVLQGTGKDSGATKQNGVSIDGDVSFVGPTRSRTIACTFKDLGGKGYHVGNVVLIHQGNSLEDPDFVSCNTGLDIGTRGEYMRLKGGSATLCNTGVSIAGGNANLGGIMTNNNGVGIDLVSGGTGTNDAHGQVSNFTSNHNTVANIRANPTDVPLFSFRDGQCHQGAVIFNACVGVELQNIAFGTITFNEYAGTRQTYVRGCAFLDEPTIAPNIGGASEVFYINNILPKTIGPTAAVRANGAYSEVNQTLQPTITSGTTLDYKFNNVTINAVTGNVSYSIIQLYSTAGGYWDYVSDDAPKTPNHNFFAKIAVNLSIGVVGGAFDATDVDVYLWDQLGSVRLATLTASVPLVVGGTTNYRVYSFMGDVPIGLGKIGIRIKNGSGGSIVVLNDATATPTHGYAGGW